MRKKIIKDQTNGKKTNTPPIRAVLQIEHQLQGKSGKQAAIAAGYSEKTATKIASENQTKPDIQEYKKMRVAEVKRTTEAEMNKVFVRANKLIDAIEEEITDPRDPDKYTVLADESEMEVICWDYSGEKPKRIVEKLSVLRLEVAKEKGFNIEGVKFRATDPRKLLIEALKGIAPFVRMLGDLGGDFKAPALHPKTIDEIFDEFRLKYPSIPESELRSMLDVESRFVN